MSTQPIDFSQYADWLRRNAGRFTAGPPQLLSQYGIQLEDWRVKPIASIYGLAEATGIPTLARWWEAILQNKPIGDVEKEYYQRIANELRQAGIDVDEQTLATRINQASMQTALVAAPLAVPFSKEEAVRLAKALGMGFGFVGGPTAIVRSAQGYNEEALKAFVETGLAGTALVDVATTLKDLAANLPSDKIDAVHRQMARLQRNLGWTNPEDVEFEREVVEAVRALKEGDTSKYDQLVRQLQDWQKTMDEFKRLYELKQKGQLSPDDEDRYYKLLQEVAKIRDRYEILKMYIDSAKDLGIEAQGRQREFENRTIQDLANAAQQAPPGPPVEDLFQRLQKMDLERLQQLLKDRQILSRFANRFGIDEQTLAEQATLMLRERQWENLANYSNEELKKLLQDRDALKKYAEQFNMSEDELMTKIEDLLRQRNALAPPEPPPEKPPIEPIRNEVRNEFRPPEREAGGGGGQVLLLKEEAKPEVRRVEELPSVEERLRAIAKMRQRLEEEEEERLREEQRTEEEQGAGQTTDQTQRTDQEQTPRNDQTPRTDQTNRTDQTSRTDQTNKTEYQTSTTQQVVTTQGREVTVLDRDALRVFIPALPAYVFAMPAMTVLALISRSVGMPVALSPDLPKPRPRESFGNWLNRVFGGSGFSWKSLAAQREAFVFA